MRLAQLRGRETCYESHERRRPPKKCRPRNAPLQVVKNASGKRAEERNRETRPNGSQQARIAPFT